MASKNTIILKKGKLYETWGSLTDLCDAHEEIRFATIKDKKFPFNYKGYDFIKVPHKTKLI